MYHMEQLGSVVGGMFRGTWLPLAPRPTWCKVALLETIKASIYARHEVADGVGDMPGSLGDNGGPTSTTRAHELALMCVRLGRESSRFPEELNACAIA